ncbi:MAG: glycine cleavage system aminomethyltransferase GcvT [Acidimicrobiales bacterium]
MTQAGSACPPGGADAPDALDAAGAARRSRGDPRSTPLVEIHKELGATLTDFAGWRMPLRFSGELAEHHAVRRTAGVFDLCHMVEIEVVGADAALALDSCVVSRLSTLEPGRARYTMLCDSSGGVVDDLVVYRRQPAEFLVVANAANGAAVTGALQEGAARLDAQVTDLSDATGLVAVQGPLAAETLRHLTAASLDDVGYYCCAMATVAGVETLLARTGYTGEDGFELFCPAQSAGSIFLALLEAGRPSGVVPAGLAARDSLRLEAGMALAGNELTVDVTPYEAGLGRVVDLEKPVDFSGRAALESRRAEGPRARLVGLVAIGRRSPRAGYDVLAPADGAISPSRIGTVTSGAPSPTLGVPIAMAYVRPDRAEPGTPLVVDVRGHHEPVEVTKLPFYKRSRHPNP